MSSVVKSRIAALIEDLAAADHLPARALRAALAHPAEIGDAALPLLERAAAGEELSAPDLNILFWGLHILAHARDSRAHAPLLALLRQDQDTLDAVLGDAVTSTLAKMLASLFDGDADPLFRLALDSSLDGAMRHAVLGACTFLCIEGRIERAALHGLLVRFDEAQAAVEGDIAWSGWEEAIALLALRDLAPRVAAAQADGRIDPMISGPDWFTEALREAERRPDDRSRLDRWQHGYLDDPVADLDWTREGYGQPQRNPVKAVGRNDPCPCGSGRKFKKCCLGKAAVEAPWAPPGSGG